MCTQKFEKQGKIDVCWGQGSKELCSWTGLKRSDCRFVFILLSVFYNLLPRVEDDLTDWWHWDNGHCWRLLIVPLGPVLRARVFYPLDLPLPGHGWCQAGSATKSVFVHSSTGAVDPVNTRPGEEYSDLRPKSSSLVHLFQHKNRYSILILFPALFLN